MKKVRLIILIVCVTLLCACNDNSKIDSGKTPDNKSTSIGEGIDIMTTNKFLYTIVKQISGNNNNIDYMFTDESEDKNFNPTSDSENNIEKKDLFIYSGAGFEGWVSNFLSKVDKNKVGVIDASRGTKITSFGNKNDAKNYNNKNPYYWMDLDNYSAMVLNIKDAIEEKDPKNIDLYETRFKSIIKNVSKYKSQIKDINSKMKNYDFVTDQDTFDYMTNDMDVKTIKFYRNDQGAISPDDEKKISDEFNSNKSLCFLYENDNDLNANKDIIDKYKMKTIKITVYNSNMSYANMMQGDINNIKSVIK
ncbi:MAG: metal ABC transporter substrate-binding protein [Clostridium sp.]|nr:metal ABC transporter substrate-binding protein [Clostridium sp.]